MIDLTVLTVVHNDSGLINHTIDSLCRHSDVPPKIIVCDNGGNKNYLKRYHNTNNIEIVNHKPKSKDAANIHGESINKIFKLVKSKYTLIIDSDCVVLNDQWYRINPKYKVVTAKKGSKGGVDKHHFCFTLFETEVLKDINFKPVHKRKEQRLPWDTGCMASQKIHDNNISTEYLKVVNCASGNGKIFGDRFPKSFELWREETPVVAHFVAGSNLERRRINKYGEGGLKQFNDWVKTINEYAKNK